jgi:hypothetical protein
LVKKYRARGLHKDKSDEQLIAAIVKQGLV